MLTPAVILLVAAAITLNPQSPPVPDVVTDLRVAESAASVGAHWRYADATVVEVDHRAAGADLKASGPPVRTHDVRPRVGTPEFEAAAWTDIEPGALEARRTNGRLAFGWYRLHFTVPDRVGEMPAAHASLVLELTADDYAEVWIDGTLSQVLGSSGGPLIAGWNTPNRVVLTRDARPGQSFDVAIFAANGPLSSPPANYVWIRSATLDWYSAPAPGEPDRLTGATPVPTTVERADPGIDEIFAPGTQAERLATGFSFIEGPVWVPTLDQRVVSKGGGTLSNPLGSYGGGGVGGYLLFSDPNQNVIHRYDPRDGSVSIFRTKSGYSGVGGYDIGAYHQPGSNGLALDPQGRLSICEHGNRRVTRLEPNGTITVLADRHEGKRLNSPNDAVYRSDGTLFFTDPPFGLPKVFDDPRKELDHSGVYALSGGVLRLASSDLRAPNGLAISPDEKHLYVDNWEEGRKVVMRYDVAADGTLSEGVVFADLTPATGEICLDGLKVDSRGNVYVSGPMPGSLSGTPTRPGAGASDAGGVWVFSPEGEHLGTLVLPELPANFAFGDADGRTLYLAARTSLYRIRTGIAGVLPVVR
jgi:gluconolactonase